jgi:hypothetical protein
MKRTRLATGVAIVGLCVLGIYGWLNSRSNAEATALFEAALVGWNVDPSAYQDVGKRSQPNQPTVRVWSRPTPNGIEEIEVTEAERLVCRSVKQAGTSDWKSLGCLQQ